MVKIGSCPNCYYEIKVDDDVILGEILECPDCNAELEVIKIEDDGIELSEAEEVADDWGE
ncbi:MAG: lysine biosynthesis protein LysW [Candidatus Lokiarchaeota archaeon]|nr:lysine biosynthesis protein LysW [Candidatus Lokiarchaeota archaeon]